MLWWDPGTGGDGGVGESRTFRCTGGDKWNQGGCSYPRDK